MVNDSYLMDMENDALHNWDNLADDIVVQKIKRVQNINWINHIRKYIDYDYLHKTKDEAIKEYIEWVLNGGGDDWFQEE